MNMVVSSLEKTDWMIYAPLIGPLVYFQIDSVVIYDDAVCFQAQLLTRTSAESIFLSDVSPGIHYFITGISVSVGIFVQNITNGACKVSVS